MSRRMVLLIVVLFVGTAVFFWTTLRTGLIVGEEFCADTFKRRDYWYYELPLVHLKITPLVRDTRQNQLEKMLIAKKYITSSPPAKRWDLIFALRGGEPWRQGDAQILCQYLDAWDFGSGADSYWEQWTIDHPKLANVLWPEIAQLARRNLYYLIPPLFEKALEHKKPAPLQSDLDQLLAAGYEQLGDTQRELENLEDAVKYYGFALQHDPDRVTSLLGRATCYEQLGKTREAARDRRAAGSKAEKEPH